MTNKSFALLPAGRTHGAVALATLPAFILFIGSFGAPRGLAAEKPKPLSAEALFDVDRLIEVEIEMQEQDWNRLRKQSRAFAAAISEERKLAPPESPFTYFKGTAVVDGRRFESVGIRKKGFFGSLDDERPSLKIKFDKYEDGRSLAGFPQLTLNNNKQDTSVVSQYLAYKVYAAAGVPASRCNFAKVTVNGNYLGIYSNVETVKETFLQRHFSDVTGNLYEGTLTDFREGWIASFEPKTKHTSTDQKDLKRLIEILKSEGEGMLEELEQVLDVDAFLKYWATESLIGFWDGYCNNQNNYFVYNDPSSSKFNFIPWGTDSAFTKRGMMQGPGPQSVKAQAIIPNRIYKTPTGAKRYGAVLMELLDSAWKEEAILQDLDRVQALLEDHLHNRQQEMDSGLRRTREFVKNRRKDILEEWANGPVAYDGNARAPMYFERVGELTATFDTQWNPSSPEIPLESGSANVRLVIDGKPVTFSQVGSSGETVQMMGPGGGASPGIVITGKRESDGKIVNIRVLCDEDLYRAGNAEPVLAQGVMMEGEGFGFNPSGMNMVAGTADFETAGQTRGDPVKGTLELKLYRMDFSRFR